MDSAKESSLLFRIFNFFFGWFLAHFKNSLSISREEIENKPVIFCLMNATFIEHLILKTSLMRNKLPPVRGSLFPGLISLKKKLDLLNSHSPILLNLSDREKEKLSHAEKLFMRLHHTSISDEVIIIPLFLSWEAATHQSERTLRKLIFGTIQNPSFIKKIYMMITRRGSAYLKNLPPIKLEDFLKNHSSNNLERKCRALRRKLVIDINDERKVTYGPFYQSTYFVSDLILQSPSFQEWLKTYCIENKIKPSIALKKARYYVKEISARQDWKIIRVFHIILDWLFTRIFQNLYIDENSLLKIRELAKKNAIVFIPNHSSHLDYLIVGYAMSIYKMAVPHTAAGINMNFFPMGTIFRRGGAYFLRRTFKDNPLYAEIFRRYVQYLIQNRFNQQFFIEGTRSRTGKLLPPKYGMLKFFVQAFDKKIIDDILFVPVSISYDQVLEIGSYLKESEGASKERESMTGLLSARKKLKTKYGNAYINFSDHISLNQTLAELFKHNNPNALSKGDLDYLLQRLAFRTLNRINRGMFVTPTSLICSVLLQGGQSAKPRDEVIENALEAFRFLVSPQYFGNVSIEINFLNDPEKFLSSALDQLLHNGTISEEFDLLFFRESRKAIGGYHKNNVVHFFVTPSLLYQALKNPENRQNLLKLEEECLRLRDLFKYEFFFSSSTKFKSEIRFLIRKFYSMPLNTEDPPFPLTLPPERYRNYLDRNLLCFAESYWCAFHTLLRHISPLTEAQLLEEIRYTSHRFLLQKTLVCPESINDFTYKSALQMAVAEGLLLLDNKIYSPSKADLNLLQKAEQNWFVLCKQMKEDFH